ncbi:MAG: SH3 domain-containing protein [Anaerolineae bacterium]|nr:SH3 domain-containing protein [Anaerolineae bacterium]
MKLLRLLFLIGLFCAVVTPGLSQEDFSPPLIWSVDDMIYVADNLVARPLTGCLPTEKIESALYQSPDGRYFAFITEPPELTKVLEEQGGIAGGQLPNNIWLCNMVNETLRPIAVQPEDFAMFTGQPDVFAIHSRPTWSPDGQRLAWGLLTANGENALVIFDLADGSFENYVLDTAFPSPAGVPMALEPLWSTEGILFPMTAFNVETSEFEEVLVVVSERGETLAQYLMNPDGSSLDFSEMNILIGTAEDVQKLALYFRETGWHVMDINTGEVTITDSVPESHVPDRPDMGFLTIMATEGIWHGWAFVNPVTSYPETFTDVPQTSIALDPLGSAVAVLSSFVEIRDNDRQYVVEGSEVREGQRLHGIIWAPTVWRLSEAGRVLLPPTATELAGQCPGTQASRLAVGGQGHVIDTVANNVRDTASTTGAVVGVLVPGTTFNVLEGPVCADGYVWFRVQNADVSGWTVEGDATGYWLAPVNP